MKLKITSLVILSILIIVFSANLYHSKPAVKAVRVVKYKLPLINHNPLTKLLKKRRSKRDFSETPLSFKSLSAILWAAQGITNEKGFRTAPSAGGLFPLTIYVVVRNVPSLSPGLYQYDNQNNQLILLMKSQLSHKVAKSSYNQMWMQEAPAIVVIAADYNITAKKYGLVAKRYVHMEVGAVAENVYLQAIQLNLATTLVGGFKEDAIKKLLGIHQQPLGLMPIGLEN